MNVDEGVFEQKSFSGTPRLFSFYVDASTKELRVSRVLDGLAMNNAHSELSLLLRFVLNASLR